VESAGRKIELDDPFVLTRKGKVIINGSTALQLRSTNW
jgi:hypothetical protein